MAASCRFCGQEFGNPQAVRAHLKGYGAYRETKGGGVAARGDEYGDGPRGGRLHIHALIGNVAGLRRYCDQRLPCGEWGMKCCMVHAWPCGYARVLQYDPRRGASYYVAKYCVKSLGDWELYGFPQSAALSAHS